MDIIIASISIGAAMFALAELTIHNLRRSRT